MTNKNSIFDIVRNMKANNMLLMTLFILQNKHKNSLYDAYTHY